MTVELVELAPFVAELVAWLGPEACSPELVGLIRAAPQDVLALERVGLAEILVRSTLVARMGVGAGFGVDTRSFAPAPVRASSWHLKSLLRPAAPRSLPIQDLRSPTKSRGQPVSSPQPCRNRPRDPRASL